MNIKMKLKMKRILSIILIYLIIFPLIPTYASYAPQFESEAQELYDMGLFKGTDAGFELEKKCDRLQAAALFIRLMGKESEAHTNLKQHPFVDVPEWANSYVGQMYYDGYTKGISHNEYGVGDVTANQFATFCLRAIGYSNFEYENALEKMFEINLIGQKEYDIIKSSKVFYRDYAVKLVYNSLFEQGNDKQNDILIKKLIDSGVIDKESVKNTISTQDNYIELDSEEDIYSLSRILSTDYAKGNYYTINHTLSLEDDFKHFSIPAELNSDNEKVRYLQNASYKLTDDINVVLTKEYGSSAWDSDAFIGIGSSSYPFMGTFDGNNKTITLSSNTTLGTFNSTVNHIGFFSEVSNAEIFDTNISISSNISTENTNGGRGFSAMGGLVGYAKASNIVNCSVIFSNSDFGINQMNETDDYTYVGGLAGRSDFTVYNDCTVDLTNSTIFVTGTTFASNLNAKFGGVSVGGFLGMSGPGSDNVSDIGKFGNRLYNCTVKSNSAGQQDVITASVVGGTEIAVGGIVGCSYNNFLAKNCSVEIVKGNISASQSESTASSVLGTAVGGIIGRMEHTGELSYCSVYGDNLNIAASGPDNRHLVGGIAGNAYGAVHRDITPINNCNFDGSGTSTLSVEVDTTNIKDKNDHVVGVGGIAGLIAYQMYDCSVKDVSIINHSEGMKAASWASEIVGVWQAKVSTNYFTPGPVEIKQCTYSGVTLDVSSNVKKLKL